MDVHGDSGLTTEATASASTELDQSVADLGVVVTLSNPDLGGFDITWRNAGPELVDGVTARIDSTSTFTVATAEAGEDCYATPGEPANTSATCLTIAVPPGTSRTYHLDADGDSTVTVALIAFTRDPDRTNNTTTFTTGAPSTGDPPPNGVPPGCASRVGGGGSSAGGLVLGAMAILRRRRR